MSAVIKELLNCRRIMYLMHFYFCDVTFQARKVHQNIQQFDAGRPKSVSSATKNAIAKPANFENAPVPTLSRTVSAKEGK